MPGGILLYSLARCRLKSAWCTLAQSNNSLRPSLIAGIAPWVMWLCSVRRLILNRASISGVVSSPAGSLLVLAPADAASVT